MRGGEGRREEKRREEKRREEKRSEENRRGEERRGEDRRGEERRGENRREEKRREEKRREEKRREEKRREEKRREEKIAYKSYVKSTKLRTRAGRFFYVVPNSLRKITICDVCGDTGHDPGAGGRAEFYCRNSPYPPDGASTTQC